MYLLDTLYLRIERRRKRYMKYNDFTLDIKTIEKNNVILPRGASTYTCGTCTLCTVTKFLCLTIEPSCNQ